MPVSIEDFSVSLDDWTYVEDPITFSALVRDTSVSGINPDLTYYTINGSTYETTVTGISSTDYTVSTGPVVVSSGIDLFLHAENYTSEAAEKDYSFLFGYHVSYTDTVDWGANKEVVIAASASNTAICPNHERYATYFNTSEYGYVDLTSYIVPTGWANLTARIEPQTMQFMYGRTYTITVSGVKDYSGNELPAFSWNFTIETL